MTKTTQFAWCMLVILVAAIAGAARGMQAAPQSTDGVPTFTRDVAPILYANCVTCHRPGEIAPMSLISYQDVRPWARAITKQIADGAMPPWHADAPTGTFSNERTLTAAEKAVLERWAAGGAPEGDPKDLKPAPTFAQGWRIGTPDAVFEMDEDYPVPARGTISYEHFYIPTNFTETKWLRAIEARPGNRALVHHILVFYEAPPEGPAVTPAIRPNREHSRIDERNPPPNRPPRNTGFPSRLIATYAPGTDAQLFPGGTALRLAPGGVLHLQVHYTANGTAGTDRSKVGLVFEKQLPGEELRVGQFINAQFTIPPGAVDYEVTTDLTFVQEATLRGLFPHTHVRGKRWSYTLELPDGTRRPLLSVPKYDFNWQTYYMFREPITVPKDARIIATAWYDNSAANKSNPDPTIAVKWGDQTWEEMQYTGILYSVKRGN
jgi:hypothetical protein